MDSKYAIVIEKVLAMSALEGDGCQVELKHGMMVEIKHSDRYCSVMIHDFYYKNLAYENNLYLCKSSALLQVPIQVWPFLVAVHDPFERVSIAKDKSFTDYIQDITEGAFLTVNGQYFNMSPITQSLMFLPEREPKDKSLDYPCIVRYIGPVEEISPGYLFGLELLVIFS